MDQEEENIDRVLDPRTIDKYVNEGVHPSEAPILALLDKLSGEPISNASLVIERWRRQSVEELGITDPPEYSYEYINWYENRIMVYTLNEKGYITRVNAEHPELPKIGFFPEQLCSLTHLTELTLVDQNISEIPECIKNLTNLRQLSLDDNDIKLIPNAIKELKNLIKLDLSYNKIRELPLFIKELPHLKQMFLADKELNLPHINILDLPDISNLEENLSLKRLSEIYAKVKKERQIEREILLNKFNEQRETTPTIYPPLEILFSPKNFAHIILWMLGNNFACVWADFKKEPINMSPATLSKYLSFLSQGNYIYKISKGAYMITESGRRRLSKIKSSIKNKE